MNSKYETKRLVLLATLMGILLVMSYTPLGYLNIGPLAISLNMIPVAIGAVALGPSGGAILGTVFGITSCLQCIGIGGTSAMGVILYEINPVLAVVQRLVARFLAGWLSGWVYVIATRVSKSKASSTASGFATGLVAALLNTVLFMTALILLFGRTDYMQGLINGRNVLTFACAFVGINAAVEMLASSLVVGAVVSALKKTRLIGGK